MPILSHLLLDPSSLDVVQGEYQWPLVALSWAIALAASYAGLDIIKLVARARHAGWQRLWLLSGAGVMGLGVWCMHFTGMHAYRLEFAIDHDPGLTLVSMLPAMLGSLAAIRVLSRAHVTHRAALGGGLGLGLGIGVMHYTGMAAMRMPATLYHALDLFLLSLLVASGLGVLSVYIYRFGRQAWGLRHARTYALASALGVSLTICGMHYVAMLAAWFVPDAGHLTPSAHASQWLIYLVGGGVLLAALLMLLAIRMQHRLHDSERYRHMTRTRLFEVMSSLQDGVVLFDDRARLRLCNKAFERLFGWSSEESVGRSLKQLAYATDIQALNERIRQTLNAEGQWSGMIEAQHRDGRRFPAWLSINRVAYADSAERDYVALLSDRSAEQQAQQRIRYQAYHDPLTELPNRRALLERLAEHEWADDGLALLALFDIDRFKVLNDSLGQDIGDELLCQLARRLKRWTHEGLLVSRLNGNEFALVARLTSPQHTPPEVAARALVEQVLATLTAEYQLHGHRYLCSLSVGMLLFVPREEEKAAALFKRAGLALREAKRQGDGWPRLFCQAQERELEARLSMERELRHAIDHGELCLHLQPQVDAGGRVIGAEALVRWEHPERGRISPGDFIPLAEESGLILPLGRWVLEEGCRILGEWRRDPARQTLKLSLNVSVRQFQQPGFVDQVLAAIAAGGAPPERLTLELTESMLLSDPQGTIDRMAQLRGIGVGFALDDFGTGYSSLAYLKSLPLDTLKIDVIFVRDLADDPQATPIAATIITLAASLGLSVIAEGVETQAQRQRLAELGCGIYQGYLFGRPVPVAEFG
ncbi:MAG: EAL domain-containing protein, partial [Pseudomonadota bacterium]